MPPVPNAHTPGGNGGTGETDELVQHYKRLLADLKQGIVDMQSGSWEVRGRLDDGQWIVLNEGLIVKNLATIRESEAIIATAEAVIADTHRT